MKKLILFFLSIGLAASAQKTILIGKEKVEIKKMTTSNFNPLGVWEIFHREWEFNCDYEWKGDKQLSLHYFHLGEQLVIDEKRIKGYSTLFSGFYETYQMKFQENFSPDKYIKSIDPRECVGNYYKNRFGNNLLAMDIDCNFGKDFELGETGDIPLNRYFVLNDDVMFQLLNYSIVFLKRNKKAKIGFPIDKEGYHVMKSDYENRNIQFEIPEDEFLPKSFVKIKLVNSIIDLEKITLYRFLSLFCSDGTYESTDWPNYIYGTPKQNIKDKWLYPKPWATLSNRSIYLPIDSLVTRKLQLSLKYNPAFGRDSLTITKFKTMISKKGEIKVEKSILYSEPNKPTKMYLIRNDSFIIIDEEKGFFYVEFNGNKTIRGWIKKSDVE
jgi:hypothetical protein